MIGDIDRICGVRIIEDLYAPEFNYKKVKRNWKERLFTRPFKPFERFKEVKDGRFILKCQYGIVCHPSTASIINMKVGS